MLRWDSQTDGQTDREHTDYNTLWVLWTNGLSYYTFVTFVY